MNALHFLIKYNSFKKELSLVEQSSGSTDIDDEEQKIQSADAIESVITVGSVDVKKSPTTERKDKLKIKVNLIFYFY
jgi:hypothetical protein